jgi:MOSC domain-containing protein YiiM
VAPSIVAIHLCTKGRQPLRSVREAHAVLQTGLEGDRHAKRDSRRQVLLVAQEVLDALGLAAGDIREQLTVRGLDVDALTPGDRLRAGTARFEVAGPCDPCERMNEIRPGLREALQGRRGRFVRVVGEGTVSVGDELIVEPGH